jgi:hypothetical protein
MIFFLVIIPKNLNIVKYTKLLFKFSLNDLLKITIFLFDNLFIVFFILFNIQDFFLSKFL